jgi:hypothetical protein
MKPYSVDRDEAMKQGDEVLNVSSLKFFRSVKRFIATIFYSALNASSLLLFKGKSSFNASSLLLFKEIHCLMLHRYYFLK